MVAITVPEQAKPVLVEKKKGGFCRVLLAFFAGLSLGLLILFLFQLSRSPFTYVVIDPDGLSLDNSIIDDNKASEATTSGPLLNEPEPNIVFEVPEEPVVVPVTETLPTEDQPSAEGTDEAERPVAPEEQPGDHDDLEDVPVTPAESEIAPESDVDSAEPENQQPEVPTDSEIPEASGEDYVGEESVSPKEPLDTGDGHERMGDDGKPCHSEMICPDEWLYFDKTKACYYLAENVTEATFNDARNECHEWNGELVSIHSWDENKFVESVAQGKKIWMGMRADASRNFEWVDGSDFDYSNWHKGEPNNFKDAAPEDCVVTHSMWGFEYGKWSDYNCEKKDGFLPLCKMWAVESTNCPIDK